MSFPTRPLTVRRLFPLCLFSVVMGLTIDEAAARGGAHARRAGLPHVALESHGARPAERTPLRVAQRPIQESAVEAVPVPVVPQVAPERAKPGRLTPDERRALRQQINDAGRDIYRPERP